MTADEQNKFMEAARDNWYKEMFYIMFNTGLRVGEVGGLKWADIDFDNKCINVTQALSCNYCKGEKKQFLTTFLYYDGISNQQLMGHAHYSTTIDIYTHVSEELMGNEIEKFKAAMNA